ncbi:MAG TPA: hypothetical protein VKV15_05985 [Bryobacteraceae bacterium]|nr:hypothetical protein [Bryobacteraceae bacterium]
MLFAILLFSHGVLAQSNDILDVSGVADPHAPAGRAVAPPFWSQAAGQADVALQGYYLGGTSQPLINASGAAVNFKEFLPGIGVVHAAVEGSGGDGFHSGTNFLGLEQAPFLGWHWDFLGGDSQRSSNVLGNTTSNIYTPDISTRGFSIAMKRADRSYQIFYGDDTLLGGPRVPYRLTLPQTVLGAAMTQNVGDRWQFAVRFLHLNTNASVLAAQTDFFLPGHVFQTSDSLAFQSCYSFSKSVKIFGEFNYTKATTFAAAPIPQKPVSFLAGWSWETEKFSLRANYVSQSVSYLPVLGYFSGDRRGPFIEGHYAFNPKIDLYASASLYSNNLEQNSSLPTFHSSGVSAGGSFVLPWKLNAAASVSTLGLRTLNPGAAETTSDNLQVNLNVSRAFGRHNLRFSEIEMNLNTNAMPQSERFTEGEDTFTWKHLALGGAVRFQGSRAAETRNTLFFRGSIQASLRKFSAYANFEQGNDLVSRSVFTTSAYTSTVFGFSTPLPGGWTLQAEAFRNNLNTALNAQNVFLFPAAGLAATQLPGFQQWSGYFRMSRQFHWGSKELFASGSFDEFAAARVPLMGTAQGLVIEHSLAGTRPAANVAVSLDHSRSVITDSFGRYSFDEVPQGAHVIGLDLDQLPVDYEPGPEQTANITVQPRSLSRSDFSVVRLANLMGRVASPSLAQVTGVVIRLADTGRYTTPDEDGKFGFYNLKEGEYTLEIDAQTIPQELQLATSGTLQVLAGAEDPSSARVEFTLEPRPQPEKPVHQILQQEIHVKTASNLPSDGEPPGGGNRTASTRRLARSKRASGKPVNAASHKD